MSFVEGLEISPNNNPKMMVLDRFVRSCLMGWVLNRQSLEPFPHGSFSTSSHIRISRRIRGTGIFTYIDPIKIDHSWIGKYISPMDPMGLSFSNSSMSPSGSLFSQPPKSSPKTKHRGTCQMPKVEHAGSSSSSAYVFGGWPEISSREGHPSVFCLVVLPRCTEWDGNIYLA